jgi:predicted DNA-binding protein (MmcQ/YjbR family)
VGPLRDEGAAFGRETRGVKDVPTICRVELLDVSDEILAKIRSLCDALPQTRERTVTSGISFYIRQKTFAFLMAVENDEGLASDLMTFRADSMERQALVEQGHPFFAIGAGSHNLGVVLDASTDWVEMGELLTESYRLVAPEKLLALLPD